MIRDFHRKWAISRRNFLQSAAGAAALAGLGLPPGLARAAGGRGRSGRKATSTCSTSWSGPTATSTPRSRPSSSRTGACRSISTISSFNDHPTKLVTMFAGGETIDVSQSSPFSFPNFIDQGLVEPLDDLPGIEAYVSDFTPFTKQVAQYDGQTMGLPYFSAIWVWNYDEDLMEQAGLDAPFEHLRGADRALRQGQAGRPRAIPDPVGRGRRPRAAARHLVQPDLEPGRHLLRQGRQPPARRRLDRARDAQMVGQHLRAGPRHLRPGIAQGAVHHLGQGVQRRQEPLPRRPTTTTASTSSTTRPSRRSPARSRRTASRATARPSA